MNENKQKTGFGGRRVSLVRMRAGQKGTIVRISGSYGIMRKLEALGIREGEEIEKISEQWMRGPVLLQHGGSQVAIGFGMASKILVEITGEE
jgi:ferrous iron transport protein A